MYPIRMQTVTFLPEEDALAGNYARDIHFWFNDDGKWDESIQQYFNNIKTCWDQIHQGNVDYYCCLAKNYCDMEGMWSETECMAIKYYKLAAEKYDNIEAIKELCVFYEETEDYPKAIKYYKMLVNILGNKHPSKN
jgi:TPR repeat protein